MTHGGNVFAVARERGWHWQDILDFSASINPLGPAPGVKPAIVEALDRIVHYPERHSHRLTEALAAEWDVHPDSILLGNGATELIHFVARAWPHRRVQLRAPVFSEFHRAYPAATLASGDREDEDTLVVLTNPVNPTGAATDVPDRPGPTLVDESFIEFSTLPSRAGSSCAVLRSLTKFYAIPGLRVGALIAPASLVTDWRKRREPWQVNVLAEAAALAALADREHARKTREFVGTERDWLRDRLGRIPFVYPDPSHANYVFCRLGYSSGALVGFLLERKIVVRDCSGWPGLDGPSVRVAVRTREENLRLLAAWAEFPCD